MITPPTPKTAERRETRSCFLHGDYTGMNQCPGCVARALYQLLEAIVTGDGAQTENLDAEFMRESMDQIAPDSDDIEMTIKKDNVFEAIRLLSERRSDGR